MHDSPKLNGTQVPELFQAFTMQEILLCSAIVFIAATLQMTIGMGFGMLASPLIALIKPEIIPGSIMIMGLVVAFSGAWRERGEISLNELKFGVGGRVIGSSIAFIALLFIPSLSAFLVLFGFMMLIAVLISAAGWRISFTGRNLLGLSVISGVMGTITAVGAPPMAIIYHTRPPQIARPTLNAFFGAGAILGLISLGASGWLSYNEVLASLLLLPAMILGIGISGQFRTIPAVWLSRGLLGLSAIASILLILRGIAAIY